MYLANIIRNIALQPKQQCMSSMVNGRSKAERCTDTMTNSVGMLSGVAFHSF